jgi:hypothetical protein
VFWSSGVL